jgi:hypothetical protein
MGIIGWAWVLGERSAVGAARRTSRGHQLLVALGELLLAAEWRPVEVHTASEFVALAVAGECPTLTTAEAAALQVVLERAGVDGLQLVVDRPPGPRSEVLQRARLLVASERVGAAGGRGHDR